MDIGERNPKRVCFLSEDAETVKEVSRRLIARDVEVLGFSNIGKLAEGIGAASEAVLVVDTKGLPRAQDTARLLSHLERGLGERPVWVCMAHSKDIQLRLWAMRAGAEAFFADPVDIDGLAERLLELTGASGGESHRILVVDDQPVDAIIAARILKNAGMETRIVGDALKVLEVLDEFRPDLVLMDLNMPGADGVELTALIREHDELHATPVVFLSSELDTGKQMRALKVGGDDFIAKPVRPERLVESVRRGIRSSDSAKKQEAAGHEWDKITGLMTRSVFQKRLDSLIGRGSGPEPGLGVLLIGLNTPEGGVGPGADLPMERLAGVLRKHLGASEVAARYDDTRFAVLAMRENEDALGVMAQTLRTELTSVVAADDLRVGVGVGLFGPRADDALTVISRAEKAFSGTYEGDGTGIEFCRPLLADGSDAQRDARLTEIVKESLASEGFHLMHQPIVALLGTPGECYETTLRLRAPDGEYIPASDFLPAAQRHGLMPAIDRWVMGRALDELQRQVKTHPQLQIIIPQTVTTLGSEDWLAWFRDQIVERGLIKHRPVLQFRLQDLRANCESAGPRFNELRGLLIKTCMNLSEEDAEGWDLIEDLGIAFVRLPLNILDSTGSGQLSGLVERAHELGSKVIAARVERPQDIARAWGGGVDFLQGDFLQLPSQEMNFDFSESTLI